MRNTHGVLLSAILGSLLFFQLPVHGQPAPQQTIGGVTKTEYDTEIRKKLEQRIETEKVTGQEEQEGGIIPEDSGPRILVESIIVEGVTILSGKEVQDIIAPYQGKELSLKSMQKVSDLITDAYRQRGYVTSRAYLPPQTIQKGILYIRVVEGKLGSLDIRGNRYFKESLIRKRVSIQPDGYFDYNALQKSLVYINEHPDRVARAILVPGKVPGSTDIVIEVEDRMPFHAGFEYDNYGSRFINKSQYSVFLEHNNLLGHDDRLYLKAQFAEANALNIQQARYVYPVSPSWDVGVYAVLSKLKLGEEFADLDANGKAQYYGIFTSKALIQETDLELRWNLGFDYKSVINDLLGVESSRDELRILKTGFDLDVSDSWGRTIVTAQIDNGLSDILGAMDDKDNHASRAGAGAKFNKGVFNLFRLQPLPFESTLLWKNSAQFSNHTLAASEQFQIGGASSVRGYTPAEHSGDTGYYTAVELSFPLYPLSKNVNVPFTKENLYDAFRLVLFYDFATAHLNKTAAGEQEDETLRGYGFGARLNINDRLNCRVEVGYPDGKLPSDGDHAHPWVEFMWKF
ncbi:MAG: ShlB/FhaC/HecB family hemolysin secretion/activation protein [Candidatus Omnitrophica bacterium]|nr:ShlB/FhaC/HecB family hemolysin secretion/activation protein [Candidatus Omnitrophota bacterium]